MIIKIDLESDLYSQIEKLVKNGKYSDLYQFLKIAINNQLMEEKGTRPLEEDNNQPKFDRKGPIGTEIQKILEQKKNDIARLLSDIPLEENEIPSNPSPLIWSFYSRFFPVKVIIRQIVILLAFEKKWLDLEKIQEEAFEEAEYRSDLLKIYEEENNIPRNKKLSTGLPSPRSELKGLRGAKKKKKESKLYASKIRFQEQFVGKVSKKYGVYNFTGACFEMGLIRVKMEGENCLISLTDQGASFALMENPIIDNDNFEHVFSKEEVQFILDKIISRFPLENIVVEKILKEVKNRDLKSEDIDEIFKEEKIKYYQSITDEKEKDRLLNTITQERVATMGRLSELKLVDWKIDREGKSVYSYPYN